MTIYNLLINAKKKKTHFAHAVRDFGRYSDLSRSKSSSRPFSFASLSNLLNKRLWYFFRSLSPFFSCRVLPLDTLFQYKISH